MPLQAATTPYALGRLLEFSVVSSKSSNQKILQALCTVCEYSLLMQPQMCSVNMTTYAHTPVSLLPVQTNGTMGDLTLFLRPNLGLRVK